MTLRREQLLALADEQIKQDILSVLVQPHHRLIGLLKARSHQIESDVSLKAIIDYGYNDIYGSW